MKVHPAPNRRNMTLTQSIQLRPPKKLRRLPHIFAKVLELPFYSDADVVVHETTDSLRFVVDTDDESIGRDVRAHTIEIHPGVTKLIVVQGVAGAHNHPPTGEMELDVWRFRLPASTRPELATASFSDGELVVTVPKGGTLDGDNLEDDDVGGNEVWGEDSKLGEREGIYGLFKQKKIHIYFILRAIMLGVVYFICFMVSSKIIGTGIYYSAVETEKG